MTNRVAHFDIYVDDVDRAIAFYQTVFGWTIQLAVPWSSLSWTPAWIIGAAIVAGWIPAWRAGRLDTMCGGSGSSVAERRRNWSRRRRSDYQNGGRSDGQD